MKRARRWTGVLAGILLLFGIGCLNYTKADAIEHHREQAAEHGWPAPDPPIFYGGVACVLVGAGLGGFVLGRGKR